MPRVLAGTRMLLSPHRPFSWWWVGFSLEPMNRRVVRYCMLLGPLTLDCFMETSWGHSNAHPKMLPNRRTTPTTCCRCWTPAARTLDRRPTAPAMCTTTTCKTRRRHLHRIARGARFFLGGETVYMACLEALAGFC